jgi:hypothetical protein
MRKILFLIAFGFMLKINASPSDSVPRCLVKVYPLNLFLNQAKIGVDYKVYKNLYIGATGAYFYGSEQSGYMSTLGLRYALYNKRKQQLSIYGNFCIAKLQTTFNYSIERFDYDPQGNLVSFIATNSWVGRHYVDLKRNNEISGYEFGVSYKYGMSPRIYVELSAAIRVLPLNSDNLYFETTDNDPYTTNHLIYHYRFSDKNDDWYSPGPGPGLKASLAWVYKLF